MKKRLSMGIGLILTFLLMVGCVPKKVSDSEQNSDSKYASNSGESENLDYENEEVYTDEINN
jgi:ABC-type oligopeptide transport system substrate-binding subunit